MRSHNVASYCTDSAGRIHVSQLEIGEPAQHTGRLRGLPQIAVRKRENLPFSSVTSGQFVALRGVVDRPIEELRDDLNKFKLLIQVER